MFHYHSRRRGRPHHLGIGFLVLVVAATITALLSVRSIDQPLKARISSVGELDALFASLDYSLSDARKGAPVPRLMLAEVPSGWDNDLDTRARKRVFFQTLLPLVLIANENAQTERDRLRRIVAALRNGEMLGAEDRRWIVQLSKRYRIDLPAPASAARFNDRTLADTLATLRQRIGPVPPSLALAQAAIESAYGTSRFATDGNALFGQWTSGAGLVPARQRAEKSAFRIAAFGTPLHSVEAYLRNLNTHNAYRAFRKKRNASGATNGLSLTPTLAAYSEKGAAYIRSLDQIIRTNRLDTLDRARLADGPRIRLLVP